ncbi:MAG: cation transporter [Myxococcales bacterium]|nr:cation transporter [Myxococcales bacterium]
MDAPPTSPPAGLASGCSASCEAEAPVTAANEDARRRWSRIALALVGATLVYNIAEAVIALYAGAQAESVALLGFGLDSAIETAAALVLIWRLAAEARGVRGEALERMEHRVHRFVGGTFLLLSAYVTAQAGWTLWTREAPRESVVGIALAAASLLIMPLVAWGKLRAASALGSASLRAEAKETLACSYLSFTLLLGLLANALAGWYWADPVAALLMIPWLVKEGREGLRGEACCR